MLEFYAALWGICSTIIVGAVIEARVTKEKYPSGEAFLAVILGPITLGALLWLAWKKK